LSRNETSSNQPTVLVVDDEESYVASLSLALRREGYRVLSASDGPSGLEVALSERPAVVLLDLMLPGLPGLDVCRAIRDGGPPQPGIIMVTAKGTDFEAVVGLESGADDYVAKPFNLNLLLARIRALVRRERRKHAAPSGAPPEQVPPSAQAGVAASHAGPGLIVLGDLVIDLEAYEVHYRGQGIDLSPRLFELLVHLVRQAGKVATRDQLLNELWGYDYAGQTRTVDVHVHWLRELLAEAGVPQGIIHTVRGVGYKLVAASLLAGGDRAADPDPAKP